jgi:hypothetical protein
MLNAYYHGEKRRQASWNPILAFRNGGPIEGSMMSQAKLGTIWTAKIPEINQQEKEGKSAKTGVFNPE